MIELIVYGIVLGSIIALGSVGLTLIWGITDLFNCAHGDRERMTYLYSFGPNRRRDSTKREIGGDDIAILIPGEDAPQ